MADKRRTRSKSHVGRFQIESLIKCENDQKVVNVDETMTEEGGITNPVFVFDEHVTTIDDAPNKNTNNTIDVKEALDKVDNETNKKDISIEKDRTLIDLVDERQSPRREPVGQDVETGSDVSEITELNEKNGLTASIRTEPVGEKNTAEPERVLGDSKGMTEKRGLTIPSIDIDEASQDGQTDSDDDGSQTTLSILVPVIGVEEVEHENGDIPTSLPFTRGDNQNVFTFDPESVSMYSRRGSYSMDRVTPRLIPRSPRRGSYGQSGDMASLTVPTLRQLRASADQYYDNNVLKPGFPDIGEAQEPPPSPGMLSTHSAWSELVRLGNSRRSSDAAQSEYSRSISDSVSNVSSSLSEHLRNLVRAFSSRTEKIKESTLQPPSPTSLSEFGGSDALSAISAEPQMRHRLDSFVPAQPEGDTISEIVRNREEEELEYRRKVKVPKWIRRLKFPHVIEPQSKLYLLWLFIVTLAFMYNAWVIPLRAVFPYQTHENLKYWLAFDYVCKLYLLWLFIVTLAFMYNAWVIPLRAVFPYQTHENLKYWLAFDYICKLYLLWLFIVTLAFMYNAWVIPLRAVFPYQTHENLKYWLAFDYVCDFIYVVDILLFKMRISFLSSGLKETHRKATRANYMKKVMFKFDCLSLIPLDLLYLINMKVNPWCRLPRLMKIQTFWEFYSRCDHLVRSAHALRILKTMTYMLFLIHIETCGYYAVSVYEGIGTNLWVYNGKGNAYIRCFYLATKTATSIGNNPLPTNTLEYGFMTAYWVSGVFVFALLIGQIRDIVDAANMVKTVYTQKMDAALNYVKNMNLPKDTQERVRTWFIYNWQQQKVTDERNLMDALPMKLRKDLAIHVHFNTLSKVKLFQDCDKTLLYDLVLKLKPILYLPNDYVCRKGEIGKEMYIVSQGIVEVVGGPDNTLVLATLKEGSVFGEISLLAMAAEGNRRTADVRCKGFTNLFILSKNDFESAMKDYPDAHALLKKRAKKLLRMNARIQRKSQSSMEQNKINSEPIIRTPPETPKLVKTVIQVMPPDSTFIKHIKRGSGASIVESDDEQGRENQGFEPGSEYNLQSKSLPTAQEAEDFYDEMLTAGGLKDLDPNDLIPEALLGERGEPEGEEIPDPDGPQQKKKISDSSVCSTDSGVQDTKVTSPTHSGSTRTISNKDSKESCIELGDVKEDSEAEDANPHVGGINYTAEMFGDIEAKSTPVKDTNEIIRPKVSVSSSPATDLTAIKDNEYAKSFAVGFDIAINSPEFECLSPKNFGMVKERTEDITETTEKDANKFLLIDEVHNLDCKRNVGHNINKTETASNDEAIVPLDKSNNVKAGVKFTDETVNIKKQSDIKEKQLAKSPRVKKRPAVPPRNKVGSKPETKKEKSRDKSPYQKSPIGNIRHNTNKINPQNSPVVMSNSKNKDKDEHTIVKNKKISTPIDGIEMFSKQKDAINEEIIDMEERVGNDLHNAIRVSEATESNITDNTLGEEPSVLDGNQVMCFAEIHREKTISPAPSRDEAQTRNSIQSSDSASPRSRKISVISIGSVLQHGRETLV